MNWAEEIRDRLCLLSSRALEHAYDVNDVLAALWQYAVPLARFEIAGDGDPSEEAQAAVASLSLIDGKSFARDGLLGEEANGLREIAERCRRDGLFRTGELLMLLCTTLAQLAQDPSPEGWSQFEVKELACPKCGLRFRYKFWQVVNAMMRPDLRAAAVSGDLRNDARCHACGTTICQLHFLYCDPRRDEFLIFWPGGEQVDSTPFARNCMEILASIPLEARGGKDRIMFLSGTPVALFQEADVCAITVCHGDRVFDEVVRDDVHNYTEATSNMAAVEDLFDGHQLSERGDWLAAAAAYARSFLKDQARVTPLGQVAVCLRNLSRDGEAKTIEREAERLRDVLVRHGLIRRIVRMKAGSSAEPNELQVQVAKSGLLPEWGFCDLCAQLYRIAEEA